MRKINFLLPLVCLILFAACSKDDTEDEQTLIPTTLEVIDSSPHIEIDELLENSLNRDFLSMDVDGYVILNNIESFNLQESDSTELAISYFFKLSDRVGAIPEGISIDNKTVTLFAPLNNYTIPDFLDYGNRYPLDCNFSGDEENPGVFRSFNHYIYQPARLNSTTNQTDFQTFDKEKDLELTWQADEQVDLEQYEELMYAYIVAPSNPIKWLPIADSKVGQATFNKEEFRDISTNTKGSFVGLLRVVYQLIDVNGKKIALIAVQDSRNRYEEFGG